MRRVGALIALVVAGLVAASLFLTNGESRRLVPHSDTGGKVQANWEAELALGVQERPDLRFDNLSPQEFMERLDAAVKRYDFHVERVELRRPKQLAPLVIVRSADPYALAKDVPEIAKSLDPKANTGDDRTGWAWEGFYFEVRDTADNRAFVVFNFWRRGGGGEWAASEELYPFPHG